MMPNCSLSLENGDIFNTTITVSTFKHSWENNAVVMS